MWFPSRAWRISPAIPGRAPAPNKAAPWREKPRNWVPFGRYIDRPVVNPCGGRLSGSFKNGLDCRRASRVCENLRSLLCLRSGPLPPASPSPQPSPARPPSPSPRPPRPTPAGGMGTTPSTRSKALTTWTAAGVCSPVRVFVIIADGLNSLELIVHAVINSRCAYLTNRLANTFLIHVHAGNCRIHIHRGSARHAGNCSDEQSSLEDELVRVAALRKTKQQVLEEVHIQHLLGPKAMFFSYLPDLAPQTCVTFDSWRHVSTSRYACSSSLTPTTSHMWERRARSRPPIRK